MKSEKTIQKRKFRTPQTHEPYKEKNDGIGQTAQGESYTIQELLNKHVNGIMPPVGLSPQYDHDNPTFDDDVTLRKPDLDLSDIDNIKDKIKTVQSETNARKKALKAKGESEAKAKRPTSDNPESERAPESQNDARGNQD